MKKTEKKLGGTDQVKLFTVITGASSGIGQATAVLMSKNKKSLIICARRKDKLNDLKKECLKNGSPEIIVLNFDIKTKIGLKIFKDFLIKNSEIKIENLINSAGLAKGSELAQQAQISDWDDMIDTNVKGLMTVTRLLLDRVIKESGHIVNLGSVAGRIVYEGGAVYCATKFAVRAFSDGLRMDLKGTKVRVTNIEPGMVNTEFSRVRLGTQQKADLVYQDMMPLSATDIADAILWCLNQPRHVNIHELVIYPTDQASVGQVVRGKNSIKNKKLR